MYTADKLIAMGATVEDDSFLKSSAIYFLLIKIVTSIHRATLLMNRHNNHYNEISGDTDSTSFHVNEPHGSYLPGTDPRPVKCSVWYGYFNLLCPSSPFVTMYFHALSM